ACREAHPVVRAGVVDQRVDATKLSDGARHRVGTGRLVGELELEEGEARAQRAQLGLAVGMQRAAAEDDRYRPLARELQTDGSADACTAACHDDDLVLKMQVHDAALLLSL